MASRGSVLSVILILLAFGGAGILFAVPWLQPAPNVSPFLQTYAPLRDKDAFLIVTTDAQGKPLRWTSRTFEILGTGPALGSELRSLTRDALRKFMRRADEADIDFDVLQARLNQAQIIRQTERTLDAQGNVSEFIAIVLRDMRGDNVISLYFPQQQAEAVFDPPVLARPASFQVGTKWESTSRMGTLDYVSQDRVLSHDSAKDCWLVESVITFTTAARSQEQYCAGKGLVETRTLDVSGRVTEQAKTFFRDEPISPDAFAAFPKISPNEPAQLYSNFNVWTMTRLGRIGSNISASEATIAPLWLPTNPPSVLASGLLGSFYAYDANETAASALWSFPLNGTVYGAPAYDGTRGRIYFGASDKRLYAFDARGIFLWSFLARDNIAARPLIANDRVIVGSEDRTVYALNADTGRVEWQAQTSSPIVSSAALANQSAILGSDDGTIYALDVNTGAMRWTFSADNAIQAPIVVEDDRAYVSARSGMLYALDVTVGDPVWSVDANASTYAPLLFDQRVYVTTNDGALVSYDSASGTQMSRSAQAQFIGTPIPVGDYLILASGDGKVYRTDRAGNILQMWESDARAFRLEPARGGDAIWLLDDHAGVWRLGAPRLSLASLPLEWFTPISEAPFQVLGITTSAIAYRDRAIVIDEGSFVYSVNPNDGSAQRIGEITTAQNKATRIDPVIADDVFYTNIGESLYALDLRDGRVLWQAQKPDLSYRPVTVANNLVLWSKLQVSDVSAQVNGTLYALDRASGAARWDRKLQGVGYPTGVTMRDGIVYTSEPAAYDLETGAERWRTTLDLLPAGEPAINDAGNVLYVGATNADEQGFIIAYDAASGQELWRKPTTTSSPSFVERLWWHNGRVIVSSLKGEIAALEGADGALRWKYTPPSQRLGTIFLQNDRVWFLLQNGRVYALDTKTGTLSAQFADVELNLTGGATQHPTVIGTHVLVPYTTSLLGLAEK